MYIAVDERKERNSIAKNKKYAGRLRIERGTFDFDSADAVMHGVIVQFWVNKDTRHNELLHKQYVSFNNVVCFIYLILINCKTCMIISTNERTIVKPIIRERKPNISSFADFLARWGLL